MWATKREGGKRERDKRKNKGKKAKSIDVRYKGRRDGREDATNKGIRKKNNDKLINMINSIFKNGKIMIANGIVSCYRQMK